MTDLTEKWKKGELEKSFYYVKGADGLFGIMPDYALYRVKLEHPENEITLLAPVPSYEELQQLKEDNRLFEDKIQNSYQKIGKLRQLLKECREIIEWYKADCGYKDLPNESVLTKIEEVLK